MLESLQPDQAVNSMLACKALANLVAAGHPLSIEKVSNVSKQLKNYDAKNTRIIIIIITSQTLF